MEEKKGPFSTSLGNGPSTSLGANGEGGESETFLAPGNNRRMQKRRKRRRVLFGKVRKEAFLAHLSETANVTASAEAAGVAVGTVYAHRLKDEEFRDHWWAALEQGTSKLVALRLQREIERAEGRLPAELEARMDGPPDPKQMTDLVKLMAALRDLTRGMAASLGSGSARSGRAPQAAGLDETCKALAKRLKAFGVRVGVVPPDEAGAVLRDDGFPACAGTGSGLTASSG